MIPYNSYFRLCNDDNDCQVHISTCEICLSIGVCYDYEASTDYCEEMRRYKNVSCGYGDGHCEPGLCAPGYICGIENLLDHHPRMSSCSRSGLFLSNVCTVEGKTGY